MGRAPCCDKANVKRGPWSPEEDGKLKDYISNYGTGGNWIALPHKAGLKRCGKSCRLRWLNYLRPNIKHGEFSDEEDRIICTLFATIGSRWSIIAAQLPGRTDNDIKNYWNTKLKKKIINMSNTIINPNFKANNQPAAILENSATPFISGSNYYNAPSYVTTEFDQTGSLVNSGGYLCPTPMQNNYLVVAGAREPSCSSEEGSYNNHHYHHQYQGMNLGETAVSMGYGLEEINQLISTNTSASTSQNGDSSNSKSYSFYFDENNTVEEGVIMYY